MEQSKATLAHIWRLIDLIRKTKPDIIQGWMYHGNLAAQLASLCTINSASVLWNIRASMYSLSYEKKNTALIIKLGAYLSRYPAAIIYNSMVSASQHETIGYRKDARVFIPNGFDTDLFIPSEEARHSVRTELRIPWESILIGLFGRYHPMKDHANFLKAASLLLERYSNIHFLLAGYGVDNANFQLIEQANNLKIQDHVQLLGERKDIPRLTAALDIGVSASYYGEGFSNVIGEAMSCGVPCVVTNIGDSAKIVGDTGIVVPPSDPQALADGCFELINMTAEQRSKLGLKARQSILDNYSLRAIVRQYEDLYERVLEKANT
jgi:glycosyltransferase involved in cell wall biosynthesis